jgi:hypothetical protein
VVVDGFPTTDKYFFERADFADGRQTDAFKGYYLKGTAGLQLVLESFAHFES